MSYRYECSYPFLAVARRHDADYGDVLTHAQYVGRCPSPQPPQSMLEANAELALPRLAKYEIVQLCALPVAERGGRVEGPDVCLHCGRSLQELSQVEAEAVQHGFCLKHGTDCPLRRVIHA